MFFENFRYKRVPDQGAPLYETIPENGKIAAAVVGIVDAAAAVLDSGDASESRVNVRVRPSLFCTWVRSLPVYVNT